MNILRLDVKIDLTKFRLFDKFIDGIKIYILEKLFFILFYKQNIRLLKLIKLWFVNSFFNHIPIVIGRFFRGLKIKIIYILLI